jgi:hypothetical protein
MPPQEDVKMADRSTRPERLRRRFRRLAKELSDVGWILHGTVCPRLLRRNNRTLGPYYQWTFKKEGKTVTVNLSRPQVKLWRRAFRQQRKVERLLDEMRSLSRDFLEATTPGVKRLKTPFRSKNGLS